MKTTFFAAFESDGQFGFEVFRFDRSGQHKAVIYRSEPVYVSAGDAEDEAVEYCNAAGLDAEKRT